MVKVIWILDDGVEKEEEWKGNDSKEVMIKHEGYLMVQEVQGFDRRKEEQVKVKNTDCSLIESMVLVV